MPTKNILISGSLAYDRILTFPGYFKDHILPEKIHTINLSFAVPEISEHFGGTAGNIAYNLSLLGLRPVIWAAAGNDFGPYKEWMRQNKIQTKYIHIAKNKPTASAYITTDMADNQITGFNVAAMSAVLRKPPLALLKQTAFAIVSPENTANMHMLSLHYKAKKIPYIFDPGQAITWLTKTQLRQCMQGAQGLIGNDYEMSLIVKKTGMKLSSITKKIPLVIETQGEQGSRIWSSSRWTRIPAVKASKVVDPTGAGDAYRAGLLYGLTEGLSHEVSGKIASLAGVYAAEHAGTQDHAYSLAQFKKRYKKAFGENMVD